MTDPVRRIRRLEHGLHNALARAKYRPASGSTEEPNPIGRHRRDATISIYALEILTMQWEPDSPAPDPGS